MIHTILYMFFAGIFAINLVPHLVKSVTQEPFPTPFGPSPAANFLGAWIMMLITGSLIWTAHIHEHPAAAAMSAALGGLCIGLFHALHGAFGKA